MRPAALTILLSVSVVAFPVFAQESTRKDFQEFCHTAILGRWVGEVTWVADWPGLGKKGDKVTAYWEARMSEDGNVVIGKFVGGDGSESSLIYFDAGAKQIKWTMVDSGGSVTHCIVFKSDGKWSQKGHGSLADGTKTEYTNAATFGADGKTVIWAGKHTVAGKPVADQRDVWRRVSK